MATESFQVGTKPLPSVEKTFSAHKRPSVKVESSSSERIYQEGSTYRTNDFGSPCLSSLTTPSTKPRKYHEAIVHSPWNHDESRARMTAQMDEVIVKMEEQLDKAFFVGVEIGRLRSEAAAEQDGVSGLARYTLNLVEERGGLKKNLAAHRDFGSPCLSSLTTPSTKPRKYHEAIVRSPWNHDESRARMTAHMDEVIVKMEEQLDKAFSVGVEIGRLRSEAATEQDGVSGLARYTLNLVEERDGLKKNLADCEETQKKMAKEQRAINKATAMEKELAELRTQIGKKNSDME